MDSRFHLGWADYVVIGLTLLISTAIGLKFQFFGNRQKTTRDYLMAGKDMAIFPVVMSTTVTIISAITILGNTMETYRFGFIFAQLIISFSIGTVLAAKIIIPVYFNCQVSTAYEFLEMRFGKTTRYINSLLFIIQMMFFMAVSLYAPVLAISAVTDLSIQASIIMFGLVCSFYCCVGGLKGVMWTDVLQSGLMFACLMVTFIFSIPEAGGFENIYKTSSEGQRLNLFKFEGDFTDSFTVMNLMARGLVASMGLYGTSQVQVQRLLSLSSIKRAQSALYWSIIPFCLLWVLCNFLGLVLYTIFKDCDPILDQVNTGLTKYDQVVPYYIVTRLHAIPGITGLCIAGILSGSLSTISSALNSLSAVTVMDFIKPLYRKKLNDTVAVYIAKALSIVFGMLCICLSFAISKVDSVVAVNHALFGLTDGPMLAVFLIGVLSRKGSQKCILIGLVIGFVLTGWLGYGIVFSGYRSPSLPIDSSGCASSFNSSLIVQNITTACEGMDPCISTVSHVNPDVIDPFILYKISPMWISPIGLFITLCAIFLAILFTGSWSHNVIPANSKCLSPVARLWIKDYELIEPSTKSEEEASLAAMNGFGITIESRNNTNT